MNWIQYTPGVPQRAGMAKTGHLIHALAQGIGGVPGGGVAVDRWHDVVFKDEVIIMLGIVTPDVPAIDLFSNWNPVVVIMII